MNLPDTWQGVSNSPIVVALLVLTGATLVVVFLAPLFFKLLQQTKFPQRLKFIKRYPRRSLAAIFAILVLIFVAYLFYYFSQPVRIISAAQFKLEKGKAVSELQSRGLVDWPKVGLYLVDVRSREEYSVGHLKASDSLPAARAVKEVYPNEKVDVVVYSAKDRFAEAKNVANAVKKNGDAKLGKHAKDVGTIFVIKDGFEGLKSAGLLTESGGWD